MSVVPKYAVLLSNLDNLLNEVPAKIRASDSFQAKLRAYRELVLSPAAGGRPPLSAAAIAALPRNPRAAVEVFHLDDRAGGEYHLRGWESFLSYFDLREPYARVLFSKGKGAFVRMRHGIVWHVSRLGVPVDPAFLPLPPPPWAPGSVEYRERERMAQLRAETDARRAKPLKSNGCKTDAKTMPPPYIEELRQQEMKRGR